MTRKKLVTPTEEAARYLRHVTDIATRHKQAFEEHERIAKRALRSGDFKDAQRCLAEATVERDSYYAARFIADRWKLPPPVHYIPPVEGGGLPDNRDPKHKPLCGAPRKGSATCGAQGVTCPACLKALLKEIDVQRLPKGWA